MAGNTCIWYPQVNGEDSRLYRDLLEKKKLSRPLANLVYAMYTATNMAKAMDNSTSPKYIRNRQGEHNMVDVLKFMDFDKWLHGQKDIDQAEKTLGAVDNNGNRVDFTNYRQALKLADDFNNSQEGLVANVIQHGGIFNIYVQEKTSGNFDQALDIRDRLNIQDYYRQIFSAVGIDMDTLPTEVRSILSRYDSQIANYLENSLKPLSFDNLYYMDALVLLSMSQNQLAVQRVLGVYATLEDAAQAIADHNTGAAKLSSYNEGLLRRAIDKAKEFNNLNLATIQSDVNKMSNNLISNSTEKKIKDTLHTLNKLYKIDINEITRVNNNIRTLSEAAAEASVQLERRINLLEKQRGNNAEEKRLKTIQNGLLKELAGKKYAASILSFLAEAATQVSEIDNMLISIPQTGAQYDDAFAVSRILQDIKSLRDQYYYILAALADEKLIIDESVPQSDIDAIRQNAKDLLRFFDNNNQKINTLVEDTMVGLLESIVGKEFPNGMAVVDAIRTAATDSTLMDYLYSMGRASNPIIGAMGKIVQNAQEERNKLLKGFSLRVRRETDKLYKSGSNSRFMYGPDGHIISDIDWARYNDAKKSQRKAFWKSGLRGFDLKQALEAWEDANTEDRVVDKVSGRTEKVPNSTYRLVNGMVWDNTNNTMTFTSTSNLSKAQQDYYNAMMQLKGEVGSFFPAYAQKQYLPPQLRRSFFDAIGQARSAKDVYKALKNKFQNLWKVREDDTNYAEKGIVMGEEAEFSEGAFDNTPLQQIPIFYINKIKDQDELMTDFSSALQSLASTAVNYYTMNNVMDVVEFMGDFVIAQQPEALNNKTQVVKNEQIRVFKKLIDWSKRNGNSAKIVEGFIQQHFYGQRIDPKTFGYKYSKLITNIIGYTSFKGLATNVKGAFSNYVVGEFQMLIEAGAGEFYGFRNYLNAHKRLFGSAGVVGEMAELLTNNMNHKATLFREMFDPIQEEYSDKSHQRYYKNMFRQFVGHDCSFLGYAAGEYLIHYVNMYAILDNVKVKLNGKTISLYEAFEVANTKDNNSELVLKRGVTDLNGNAITEEFLQDVKDKIKYANQTTHGSMNAEDKGIIHQHLMGRAVMNFRQWMVEHYSRRFRGLHYDASLNMDREGYWVSLWKGLMNDNTKDTWRAGQKKDAVWMFMKDFMTFMFRASANWKNLNEMQKYNVKRVRTEMLMYISLLGLSFALGEPDEHKKEFWRRWWIYQTKRLILDTEASMPNVKAVDSALTILQSPMAGVNTLNSLLYLVSGWRDIGDTIKSGPHKGENRYWRNFKKYALPFFKDWEQMQRMSEDESIFKIFENSPSNY